MIDLTLLFPGSNQTFTVLRSIGCCRYRVTSLVSTVIVLAPGSGLK